MGLPEEEQAEAKKTYLGIVRAYETLTQKEKFDNWISFGNPDGSVAQ